MPRSESSSVSVSAILFRSLYQNGVRKGETGVVNKGRLLQVTFAKVDGQTFELPPEEVIVAETAAD